MRPYVSRLDTNAMQWQKTDTAGLLTKSLSLDSETGARTAIQRMDVGQGYEPYPSAHFHHVDEELFFIKGSFTFDGERWLGPMSHCYHPAGTVHGFRSDVDEEAWCISRISGELDHNPVDQPRGSTPYSVAAATSGRPYSISADPFREQWHEVKNDAGEVTLKRLLLGRNPDTGEGTMLVRFEPGWQSPYGHHFHTVYEEAFIVEGEVEMDEGAVFTAGCYTFKPPFTVQGSSQSPAGALALISFGGKMDFRPASELKSG